jgi:hypothetical protein
MHKRLGIPQFERKSLFANLANLTGRSHRSRRAGAQNHGEVKFSMKLRRSLDGARWEVWLATGYRISGSNGFNPSSLASTMSDNFKVIPFPPARYERRKPENHLVRREVDAAKDTGDPIRRWIQLSVRQ